MRVRSAPGRCGSAPIGACHEHVHAVNRCAGVNRGSGRSCPGGLPEGARPRERRWSRRQRAPACEGVRGSRVRGRGGFRGGRNGAARGCCGAPRSTAGSLCGRLPGRLPGAADEGRRGGGRWRGGGRTGAGVGGPAVGRLPLCAPDRRIRAADARRGAAAPVGAAGGRRSAEGGVGGRGRRAVRRGACGGAPRQGARAERPVPRGPVREAPGPGRLCPPRGRRGGHGVRSPGRCRSPVGRRRVGELGSTAGAPAPGRSDAGPAPDH